MSIHPNAPPRPSKGQINDPEELLESILRSDPRPRRKDAESRVLERFPWWNRWKPGWRPPEFQSSGRSPSPQEDGARTSSYQARREEALRQRQCRERQQRDEDARASQHRSGSGKKGEAAETLFEQGDKALNNWSLKAAESSYDDLLVQDHHTADDVVGILFTALNRMRDERDAAISTIEALAAERARLKGYMAAQNSPAENPDSLFRKVGLDQDCPDFLLKAARLAFRKDLHPDLHPDHLRGEAERRFKEAEAAFEELFKVRRL